MNFRQFLSSMIPDLSNRTVYDQDKRSAGDSYQIHFESDNDEKSVKPLIPLKSFSQKQPPQFEDGRNSENNPGVLQPPLSKVSRTNTHLNLRNVISALECILCTRTAVPPIKNNARRKEEKISCHTENFLKRNLTDVPTIQLVKKLFIDIPKSYFPEIPDKLKYNLEIQFFKAILFQNFNEIVSWEATIQVLVNGKTFNISACKEGKRCLEMPSQQNNSAIMNELVDPSDSNLLTFSHPGILESNSTLKDNIHKANEKSTKRHKKASNIKKKNALESAEKETVINKEVNYLPLQTPLLLNYIKRKKIKQILLYKTYSIPHYPEKQRMPNKIHRDIAARSVEYDEEQINLIFEPLKVINRLKQKKNDFLVWVHSSKGKHDSAKNSALKCKYNIDQDPKYSELTNTVSKTDVTLENDKYIKLSEKTPFQSNAKCPRCSNLMDSLSSIGIKNNSLSVNAESQEKNKQKMIPRRKSLTALKSVNARKVATSVFRHFFHFYSLIGGRLKSGSVITKYNSNYWLKVSGVASDSYTLRLAGDLFATAAGRKVVLNIYEYLKFLVAFARSKKLIVTELLEQMMVHDFNGSIPFKTYPRITTLKNQSESDQTSHQDNQLKTSQSLPDLRKTRFYVNY